MPGVCALPGIDTGRKRPRSTHTPGNAPGNAPGIASTSLCALCPRALGSAATSASRAWPRCFTGGACAIGHGLWCFAALRAGLAEARGDHHGRFHAARRTVVHGGHGLVAADDEQRQFRGLGQCGERGVALEALHLVVRRIDRVDAPGKAVLLHAMDRPPADLVDVPGSTDDGNGLRVERGFAQIGHGLFHRDGERRGRVVRRVAMPLRRVPSPGRSCMGIVSPPGCGLREPLRPTLRSRHAASGQRRRACPAPPPRPPRAASG